VSPDRYSALTLPQPKTPEEERALVDAFRSGLEKLFRREDNWTFLRPLLITIEHCVRCQTCAEACHIFTGSGRQEIYRPTYRSEILRRLYFKYVQHRRWQGAVELDWKTVCTLAELAYRCNLCRRCAQTCPMGATTAWWRMSCASSSARKWASRLRNCTAPVRWCSFAPAPPPA